MIFSSNNETELSQFDELLSLTISNLNDKSLKTPSEIGSLIGTKLEPYVKDLMSEIAEGTPFENSIELISGQKFPDILAKKYFGVEVKTTTQNHWKTTGNSIFEGTRVDGVERIFMLFGKLAAPIEFKYRPYEDCLSDIVVTHSPRYQIDMELPVGATIFDKIDTTYDELRNLENPIVPIVDYYKSKLKPGDNLWWIDQSNEKSSNLIVKMWNNLSPNEKKEIIIQAFIFFPEILSNSPTKFSRVALWLVTVKGVVCPNVRDLFTAGGKEEYISADGRLIVPKVFFKLIENLNEIVNELSSTPSEVLSEFWEVPIRRGNFLSTWIRLIAINANTLPDLSGVNVVGILLKEISF